MLFTLANFDKDIHKYVIFCQIKENLKIIHCSINSSIHLNNILKYNKSINNNFKILTLIVIMKLKKKTVS